MKRFFSFGNVTPSSSVRVLWFVLLTLFAAGSPLFASHNRAGEITYKHIANLEYEITITTYTKTSSFSADRPILDTVHLGDGSVTSFVRESKTDLPNDISINVYRKRYIYPGSGVYVIYFVDPNRNGGVKNIPNSFFTPFAIQTVLTINSNFPGNSSPVLTNPPIDQGCKNIPFIHNPAAFDPDGDSLSYHLTVCRGDGNLFIPGYVYPQASNSFSLNPVTGDLIWDSPVDTGEFNVAFLVREWRNGYMLSEVTRDMQIRIGMCNHSPPAIAQVADTCVLAGTSLVIPVTAVDPDGHQVTLDAFGGPFFITDPATFTPPTDNGLNDTVTGTFLWQTTCNHIQRQPYRVEFKARDNGSPVNLVDIKGFSITVIAPPPSNLQTSPDGNHIDLTWDAAPCPGAVRYNIYRRIGTYTGLFTCPCETGPPAGSAFVLIGSSNSGNDFSFTDSNQGAGLSNGTLYCYLVTAVYADGSESCVSNQSCAQLKKDLPVITNVSVEETNTTTGKIYIAWSKATELDTIAFPGPYQYRLYHSPDQSGSGFSLVATLNSENDTAFIDTLLNTAGSAWSYKVELYYTEQAALVLKGTSQKASSVFLTITPSDNINRLSWTETVPWTNFSYDVFRLNAVTSLWDSITTTAARSYVDSNLANGTSYCYYIRSNGRYGSPGIIDPIVNLSQQVCATPVDNVAPCAPALTVLSDCEQNTNRLTWTNPNSTCAGDVEKYLVYYAPASGSSFEVIAVVTNANDTVYLHSLSLSLSGCYRVTALDSAGNESLFNEICVDTCRQYVLPSVFSPGNDGKNDLYHPCDSTTSPELWANCPPYKNVKDIDLKIYSRWGKLVFETTDRDINWDGANQFTNKECSDGVYYYTCRVNFFSIAGTVSKELNGYIHLIRKK